MLFLYPGQVYFTLRGISYANNSEVLLACIGEGNNALLCFTKNNSCCSMPNRAGEWYYPNNMSVESKMSGGDIYRGRGPSVVRLSRRNNAQTTGVFRCEVPDASGTNQQLYVNISKYI